MHFKDAVFFKALMKDYIIVGFGLAGIHIAQQLEKRNKSFVVFDENKENASLVAGGVCNPLILKRFTKAWNIEEFLPHSKKTYHQFEKDLNIEIHQPISIYRKIYSIEEQNNWFVAHDKPGLSKFMDDKIHNLPNIKSEFGFGKVLQASIVNIEKLSNTYKEKLINKNCFIQQKIDFSKLSIQENYISYNNIKAKKIIFCEGHQLLKNPFFDNLPLVGNKGEYLVFKAPELKLNAILKSSYTLIPLGNDYYKFGATYSRDYKNEKSEKPTQTHLIDKLEELIDFPYTLKGFDVGIRPTVLDRRPLLGKHPKHQNILLCNGLGTHGIMMASTIAEKLLDFDIENKPLPSLINLNRYVEKK